MSSSDSFLRPPRKPSTDSGYVGPSRETSTAFLQKQNSRELGSIHEELQVVRMSSEPQSSIYTRETNENTIQKFCDDKVAGEGHPHPFTFKDIGGMPTDTTFSQAGYSQDVFTSYSVPNLLSTQDGSNFRPMTHSSSVNPNYTEVGLGLRRISSATPSQQSTAIFSKTVTLSSSDSQSTFNINISISSTETQSQSHGTHHPSAATPHSEQSTLEQHRSLTAEHEAILKRTVTKKTHIFIDNTNFETLIPYLFEQKLVHVGESEILQGTASHLKKGNHFYTVVLPQKGKRAYRRLYKCLKREQRHLGHNDLVQILDNALNNHESPPSSSGSTPTNEEDIMDNSEVKKHGINSAHDSNPDDCNKSHQCHVNGSFNETCVRDDSLRSDPSNSVQPDHDGKISSRNNNRTSNGCCTVL